MKNIFETFLLLVNYSDWTLISAHVARTISWGVHTPELDMILMSRRPQDAPMIKIKDTLPLSEVNFT